MGNAPAVVSTWNGPPGTLGAVAAEVTRWLKGDLRNTQGQAQIRDAINDAISALWMSAIKVKLSRFIGTDSPVTLQIGSNVERIQFAAVNDPLNPPVAVGAANPNAILPVRTIKFCMTVVTESGSETNPSPLATAITGGVGQLFAAESGIPQPSSVPQTPGVVGWNLYAGQNNLGLQNQQPIPFGVTWIEPLSGVQDYPNAQQQPPITNTTYDSLAYIEHLEAQMPDGTHIAWNQSSIDSNMMRRLARIFPNASQYQTFVWDILNGNVMELRPQTGIAFTTRYWYVSKPRRLRYDQARLPYTQLMGAYEFYRDFAIMKCKLSLEEYLAFQAWQGVTQAEMNAILESLNQENWGVDARVVPYLYG
jgi:hypothetical protein